MSQIRGNAKIISLSRDGQIDPTGKDAAPDHPYAPVMLGLSYRTASLDIRSRIWAQGMDSTIEEKLRTLPEITEGAVLSTCARLELYGVTRHGDATPLLRWLSSFSECAESWLRPYIYVHTAEQAVHHLSRVACGLDSPILGESQILGQVKRSFARARENHTTGAILNRLSEHAVATAKRVRTETGIGRCPISVASAATAEIKRLLDPLDNLTGVVIGAGENAALTITHLREKGLRNLIIVNRTLSRAEELAHSVGAQAMPLEELNIALDKADFVISTTGSRQLIIDRPLLASSLAHRGPRPLVILDLAAPRDVAPEAAHLPNVHLLTLDDLERISQANRYQRKSEAEVAETLVDQGVKQFMLWLGGRRAVPTICALREQVNRQRAFILERARRQLQAGHPAEEVLERMTYALTARLLHRPIVAVRETRVEEQPALMAALEHLFELRPMGLQDKETIYE
ncbi:MAG: glutamyl-tRNA reductase [Gammaproteobacteria bacterium]